MKALGDRTRDNRQVTREIPIRWKKNFIIMKTVRCWYRCQSERLWNLHLWKYNSLRQGPEQPQLTGPASRRELDQVTPEIPSTPNLKNEAYHSDLDVEVHNSM